MTPIEALERVSARLKSYQLTHDEFQLKKAQDIINLAVDEAKEKEASHERS